MSRQVKVEFSTIAYECSHGSKQPRGIGSWAFALERNPRMDDVWFSPGGMTLANAKKAAAAHYRAKLDAESKAPTCGGYALIMVYVQP